MEGRQRSRPHSTNTISIACTCTLHGLCSVLPTACRFALRQLHCTRLNQFSQVPCPPVMSSPLAQWSSRAAPDGITSTPSPPRLHFSPALTSGLACPTGPCRHQTGETSQVSVGVPATTPSVTPCWRVTAEAFLCACNSLYIYIYIYI